GPGGNAGRTRQGSAHRQHRLVSPTGGLPGGIARRPRRHAMRGRILGRPAVMVNAARVLTLAEPEASIRRLVFQPSLPPDEAQRAASHAIWTFPSVLASAFVLAWGAEAAQFYVSQGLALAILAWLQGLPECASEA